MFIAKMNGRRKTAASRQSKPELRPGADEGVRPYMIAALLRGFAGTFAVQGLFGASVGAAHVDLDLLRLRFGLLGQRDLQYALVVVRRNLLGVYGLGQGEGAGEAAVLALHAAIVLFFLFLFDLALAVHGQDVVFDLDIDILLVDSRHFNLQRDLVLILVDVNGRGEARRGQRIVPVRAVVGLTEGA